MNVTINFENGQFIIIEFSTVIPLSSLIKLVSNQTHLNYDEINFFYKNTFISPELTLTDLNITKPPIFQCKAQRTIKISIPDEAEDEEKDSALISSNTLISPDIKNAKMRWLQDMGFDNDISKKILEKNGYDIEKTVSILRSENQKINQSSSDDNNDDDNDDESEEEEMSDKNEIKQKITEWNSADDLLLYKKYLKYGAKWNRIRKYFPEKSVKNIKHHWRKKLKPRLLENIEIEQYIGKEDRKWTKEENEIVFAMWKCYGNDWNKISSSLRGRSTKSIQEHWEKEMQPVLIENDIISNTPNDHHNIDFSVLFPEDDDDQELGITKDGVWTKDDDIALLKYINTKSVTSIDWDQLVSIFPKHTFNGIKNRVKLLYHPSKTVEEKQLPRVFPDASQLIEVKKESDYPYPENEIITSEHESQEYATDDSNDYEEEEDVTLEEPPFDLLAKVWTPEEDQLIIQCLKQYGYKWYKFVHLFPNVSYLAVQERFKMIKNKLSKDDLTEIENSDKINPAPSKETHHTDNDKPNDKRRNRSSYSNWTEQEKQAFNEAFEKYGCNYSKIQTMIPTKSVQAIVAYIYKNINPSLIDKSYEQYKTNESKNKNRKYQRFTPEEDFLLLQHGSNITDFTKITHMFHGRTPESLRYRYSRLVNNNINSSP